MKRGRWTSEEDRILTEHHLKKSSSEIGRMLNRTTTAVRHRAVRLGITIPPEHPLLPWDEDEIQFLRDNHETMTAPQMARHLKRSVKAIRKQSIAQNLRNVDPRIQKWLLPSAMVNMAPLQLGYFAGIVDGEGTISIHKVRPSGRNGQFRYQPLMSISGTDVRLAEYLKTILNATHNTFFRPRKNRNHKPQFVTGWYGYRCYPLIKMIEPHLLIKREQAQIVMRFIESRATMPGYNLPYTQEQHDLYEKIRDLNQR